MLIEDCGNNFGITEIDDILLSFCQEIIGFEVHLWVNPNVIEIFTTEMCFLRVDKLVLHMLNKA